MMFHFPTVFQCCSYSTFIKKSKSQQSDPNLFDLFLQQKPDHQDLINTIFQDHLNLLPIEGKTQHVCFLPRNNHYSQFIKKINIVFNTIKKNEDTLLKKSILNVDNQHFFFKKNDIAARFEKSILMFRNCYCEFLEQQATPNPQTTPPSRLLEECTKILDQLKTFDSLRDKQKLNVQDINQLQYRSLKITEV